MPRVRNATFKEDRQIAEKERRLKEMDKKDGGSRYAEFRKSEDEKFAKAKELDRQERKEQRRRRILGGSGGKR